MAYINAVDTNLVLAKTFCTEFDARAQVDAGHY